MRRPHLGDSTHAVAGGAPTSAADSRHRRQSAPPHRIDGVRVTARCRGPDGYATLHTRSATKTDTPIRDVPQVVTVVTRQLIADQAMQSMADVVRYVPGLTMPLGEGHRDAPTIRGQNTTADFFIDGVRDDGGQGWGDGAARPADDRIALEPGAAHASVRRRTRPRGTSTGQRREPAGRALRRDGARRQHHAWDAEAGSGDADDGAAVSAAAAGSVRPSCEAARS